ncbi:MAG TPA: glycosyltransferase [Pirellulales bacterium]|jgi:glycosyltransferase involved in cell wall biosynthesis
MPRILHIVPSLKLDGATKLLALLATELPGIGFDSEIIALQATRSASEMLHGNGIGPKVIRWRGTLDAIAFWRMLQRIRRHKPDIVHLWSMKRGGYAALLATRTAGVRRIVVSLRPPDGRKYNGPRASCRWLEKRADRFIVNGSAAGDAVATWGISSDKFATIPAAVAPFVKSLISRQELLAELKLPTDAKLIAYLGPLTKEKRLKELIWAIDQLKAVGVTAHLVVVGEGPLRGALERYCWLNRVEDQVHFLGFQDDIARLLSHIDVLWEAGAGEEHSDAILEAMSAGIPVVAADALGNRELVLSGETGYLVPQQERAGFARCTLPLLENPELAGELGAAGRRRAMQFYRVDEMVARYAELYRQLLE